MKEFHRAEIEKFFDNEYKDLFNVIKKRKWYTDKELNNYNDEITCEITKEYFYDYVNDIHEIFNDKNIKKC